MRRNLPRRIENCPEKLRTAKKTTHKTGLIPRKLLRKLENCPENTTAAQKN